MEKDKLDKIMNNQAILNSKLDYIIWLLHDNQQMNNCQMFIQGLTLADIMNVEDNEKNEHSNIFRTFK